MAELNEQMAIKVLHATGIIQTITEKLISGKSVAVLVYFKCTRFFSEEKKG